ncbi:hypothetical protein ACFE04_023599 [Oxalis oulophora]
MALPLCASQLQPYKLRLLSSLSPSHRQHTNNSFRFSNNKRRYVFRLNLSSSSPPINGFTYFEKAESVSEEKEDNVDVEEVTDRIKNWISFVRSILPGGEWWTFTDDVEVKFLAKPVTVWRALSKMWLLVSRDRWIIFAAFTTLIVAALSEISIPHFLTATIFTAQSGNVQLFHQNVRCLILLCVSAAICSGLRGCCFGIANMVLVKRMRETLYSALLVQDISFFDDVTVGDLTSRLGSDCQQVSRVIGNDLNLIMRNALQGAGALIYLLFLSWPLGLCTLAICSSLAAVMLTYGIYQKKTAKLVQEYTASANDVSQETFSLIRTVRVYGSERQELQRYEHWLGKLADISLRQSAAYGFWNLSFNTLYHTTQVIAVLLGGMFILSGSITAEKLTKFILYSEWLIYSTWWVGDNLSNLMTSIGASEKVFQLMDMVPSSQFTSKGKEEVAKADRAYRVQKCVAVLQEVSLSVQPSEVVAIVGLSGSGKSTLVNLLLRLYEPTHGQILIDGFPLSELDIRWFRERVGYVGQEPKLFRMDISSNIKYGCPRDVTQDDIEWAAKQAYAHDFITLLPNGYNTLVDDDLLSGGQKQRIAIARALLRDPSILILDEATSALDAESEHNVKGVLRAIRNDSRTKRTVIVIAHRLSTIQAADRIVVMDSGKIVEMGSHKELLQRGGLYARLATRQEDAVA